MKMRNRILSVFLTAAIIFSSIPTNASSEEDDAFAEDGSVSTETMETTEKTSSDESNEEIGAEWFEVQLSLVEPRIHLDELEELARLAGVTASIDKVEKKITVDDGGLILLSNTNEDLGEYTIFLSTLSGGYADLTSTITIEGVSYSFKGLGSDTTPFSGAIESQDTSYGVIVNVPFFNYVDVSKARLTNLQTLKIKRRNTTTALLANVMRGESNDTWSSLAIQAEKDSSTDGGTTTEYLPGELISTMEAGASLSLGTVTYQDGAEVSPDSDNAGLLCNTMNANSCLSVQQLTVAENVTITATNGSAGGLVGLMNSGARLKVPADETTGTVTISPNYTIQGQNAGGLIGSGTDVNLSEASVTIDGANVKGSIAAGGLIGSYSCTTDETAGTFAAYDGSDQSNLKVTQVNLQATADNANAGGVFGILELKSDYTISNACVDSVIVDGKKSNYGGLIGQVKGDFSDSLRALTIEGNTAPETSTAVNLNRYGGAVAFVGAENSPVYVKINGTFTPSFSGVENGGCFGGAAAYLKDASVLELDAAFKPTGCTNISKGGGVLGNAERGSTLCLAGTTDLSDTKFTEKNIGSNTGQIVGTQESALIYAKSTWILIRQSTAQPLDDIGSYGEVIRLGGNTGTGVISGEPSGLSADLISQNEFTHKTVFLSEAKLTPGDGNTFTVTSADELALIAIEEQTKCAFHIYGTGTDYYLKSNANITLGADISLAHTGIIGVQRDIDLGYAYDGTLDGGGYTLSMAAGEIYGYRGAEGTPASKDTAGSGQIHGHNQVGFFSQANGPMKNLTVNGEMNLYFRGDFIAGGLVARNTWNGSFDAVRTEVKINCQGTSGGSVGGLIGKKDSGGGSVTLSDCTGRAAIDIGNSGIYAGGLIGNYNSTATLTIERTTLNGTMTAENATDARLGGLISRIAVGGGNDFSAVPVTLTDITVKGQKITGNNINRSCGALLGYEWNNATVTFGDILSHSNGVAVEGNCAVTINGDADGAGLVYAATGYWQLNDITLKNLSLSSDAGDLGILVYRGWRRDSENAKPYLLYIEETDYQAYDIQNDVTVNNDGGCFDEWVVYTCLDKTTITENGNSVISIATRAGTKVEGVRAGVNPTDDTCTSYQNRTEYGKTAAPNPNARYYYDLDVIREKATKDGYLDTPGELVLWAVWRYSEEKSNSTVCGKKSNIQDYFLITNKTYDIYGTTMDGNNAALDLTGYAYYPITVDGYPLEVKNITIKFANEEIENAENLTGDTLDSLNRTTVGTQESHTQHYLMHSGLLLDYKNSTTSGDVTMSVSNVTFQGTIGKGTNDGSGALICGQLGGNADATTPKYTNLDINGLGLILSGITVNADKTADTGYAPLLVNRVGSYTSLSAQQVSVADSSYSGTTSANNPAATSLIGHVGGENATNISLAFYNGIVLNGKPDNSIFSHATLLESFQYQDANSSGYYHFNQNENCTYGKEITESVEYAGLQEHYFDDQSVRVTDNGNDNFGNYLPYVCKPYTDGNDKYHELEINTKSADLTEGCGTYDDPYLITSPGQLLRAAQFINGGKPQRGWKVNKVTAPGTIKTDENANHTEYEVGTLGWTDGTMRDYLRGAYYQIQDDLDLSNFPGFGSGTYAFVGVIDGNGKTVKINAAKNESGLINVSFGSVVRNLTIEYSGTQTFTGEAKDTDNKSNNVTEKSYFGGIIGTVKGGDSLIDNVTVKFDTKFSITTSNDLQCAGGFVGLIQGGGVVFRNMGDTTKNPGYTGKGSKNQYYVDTYIGRVLDGYAINEVETAETGASVTFAAGEGKNYSIPDIDSNEKIVWNEGSITIGNAEQMIIFTDIINSGGASGGSALAYASGQAKTRNADYSKIGNINGEEFEAAFNASRTDDTTLGAGNYAYLIKQYAGDNVGFWTACTTGAVSVAFTENAAIDLSTYGNGYRGIGGRYNCTANQNSSGAGDLTRNTPKIETVTGNGVSLHVENNIAEYKNDNFYANSVGGLFNVLRHEGASITGVNVYGTVKVCAGLGTKNKDLEATYLARAPVGGVIGRDYCPNDTNQVLTLTNTSFGTDTDAAGSLIYGECVTGGLIGSSGSYAKAVLDNGKKNKTVLSLTNCSYQNVNITGGVASGGLVASGVPNSATIVNRSESGASTAQSGIKISVSESLISGKNANLCILYNVASGDGTSNGVGGLIGFCGTTLTIEGTEANPVKIQSITVQGAGDTLRGRVGGLVGFMASNNNTNGSKADCTITYANLSNINIGMSDSYDDNAGAIVGTWYSYGTLRCQDCVVDTADIQANSSGGIVGYAAKGPIQSIRITLSTVTVRKRGNNRYAGGLGGQVSSAFYGQNILMQSMTYVDKSNDINNLGRFFGTGLYARLIGVTIQDTANLPTYEIRGVANADLGTSNYVVYAGYDSNGIISTASDIATRPSQVILGDPITGGLHGDTVEPTTVRNAAADTTFYQNVGTKDKLTESICSTYNIHQDTTLAESSDFPVVLIDGDASVLKQYLNAATNGGFDYMRKYQSTNTSGGKMEVSIDRYLYDKGSKTFGICDANAYPATLKYHSATGEFTTTAQYDNQKDTFTLVTVTMTGYDSNEKFVLHIPVIVRRMLQVDFMATMTSGTVFNKTDDFYSETRNHALAAQGENITGYLTFHYNSNASDTANPASYDWQSYMEAGGDLLGYYKKTVDTGVNILPAGTKITLIDCQNNDKRYYADVAGEGTDLELFNGGNLNYKASDGKEFTPSTLSDLLQITATGATDEQKENASIIKWVRVYSDDASATVKDKDGYYYRLYDAAKDQSITDLYTLTVGNSSPKENYFVVISVPKAENHRMTLYKSGMVWSYSGASPPLEVHQVHRYAPSTLNEESISEASFNYLANYTQTLTDNTITENVQVQTTSAKADLPISVTNAVSFNSKNYTDTDPLYQKLVISLKKREDGVTTSVGLPSDAVAVEKLVNENGTSNTTKENAVKLYAYYIDASNNRHYYAWNGSQLVDSGASRRPATSYSWSGSTDSAEMVLPFAQKTGDGYQYINLSGLRKASGNQFYLEVETTLELSVASILSNNTIPYDSANGDISNFTQVDAVSILSFTESGLSYSTLRGSTSGRQNIRKYYLNTARNAVLKLDYTNIDQLGINAREDKNAAIDTVLTLDFSNMEGFTSDVRNFQTLNEADTVKFTLSLKKKGETGYGDVQIGTYMTGAAITGGSEQLTGYTITLRKNEDGSYPYYHEQTGQFIIPISFTVNMDDNEYANYRIYADVELFKGNAGQTLEADRSGAYITYTFAKINVNGYWNQLTG